MANEFVTLLDDAGNKIKAIFAKAQPIIAGAVVIAKDVEPIVDLAFPGIGALFTSTVAAVGVAQATGAAAAAGAATGAAKLASVLAAIEPIATAYLAQNNIKVNSAQLTGWTNGIVAALQALPASTPVTPAA
jgi:hypothetical protein